MDLHLQFGHGMMEHSRVLISAWGGGTVLLSPRDLHAGQLESLARDVNRVAGGHVLLDPQFYLPHANHGRLCAHDFWPSEYATGMFWSGAGLSLLLQRLHTLNVNLATRAFILPGILADKVDDDWLATQRAVVDEAKRIVADIPLLATVALSADACRSQDQIAEVIEDSATWNVSGLYLVCEHPNGDYLVGDPNWLANVMDLAAGARLRGQEVILGYCTHQLLIAATAGASAMCSGTWMNVRSFPPEKFQTTYDDEIKQRATWYYCPQALSEYKIPFLDIAHRQGVLGEMAADSALGSSYADHLFSGGQPSALELSEQAAFRHYLQCLHAQATAAKTQSFDETVSLHNRALDEAEVLLRRLRALGVLGQLRDFAQYIDVNRAALAVHVATRGPVLRRHWSNW